MRRREAIRNAGAAAVAALAGCAGSDGGSGDGADETPDGTVVEVGPNGQFKFAPGTDQPLEIAAGTTVTWIWRSSNHNVVVDSQPEGANWEGHESIENAGFTYQHTFEVPGSYHYYCAPHRSAGMVADVAVE